MHGLTIEILLNAYAHGYFPMAESANDEDLFWVDPEQRGIIPLNAFHMPKRLMKTVRQDRFRVTVDQAFAEVMRACAAAVPGREKTWINRTILALYQELHAKGFAHSVECWQDGALAGGLYGVSLGGAFFGESMFHTVRDASKVALAHLVARLKVGGYVLLDTQFITQHLQQFGAVEIPRKAYRKLLAAALEENGDYGALPADVSGAGVLQAITQTS